MGAECTLYSRAKHTNRTPQLQFDVICSIFLAAIHLIKTLWNEEIKTVVYLKNRSFAINGITSYELDNHVWPDIIHLKVVGFRE